MVCTPLHPSSSPAPKATSVEPPRGIFVSVSLTRDWEDGFQHAVVVLSLTLWSGGWEIWSSPSMWLVSYNEFPLLVIVSFCHSWVEIQPFSSLSISPHFQVPCPSFESGNSINTDQTWDRTSGCCAASLSWTSEGAHFTELPILMISKMVSEPHLLFWLGA